MKSIDMCAQAKSGTGSGCSNPGDKQCSDLLIWQTGQDLMKDVTAAFSPGHANMSFIL
jgi:hypothetical protein